MKKKNQTAGIYAIGDLQGCLKPFKKRLKLSPIDLSVDQLWVAGGGAEEELAHCIRALVFRRCLV